MKIFESRKNRNALLFLGIIGLIGLLIWGPDLRFGPDFRFNSKILNPLDGSFDSSAVNILDFNDSNDVKIFLDALFPVGTEKNKVKVWFERQEGLLEKSERELGDQNNSSELFYRFEDIEHCFFSPRSKLGIEILFNADARLEKIAIISCGYNYTRREK